MPINFLVLTDKSLAASSVDDVLLQHGFKCNERISTKGDFLFSPSYNGLLSLDDTLTSLLKFSLDDVMDVIYQLELHGDWKEREYDPRSGLSQSNVAFSENCSHDHHCLFRPLENVIELSKSVRFYTLSPQQALDLPLIKRNFAGVLLFLTETLSSSTHFAPELLLLLEAVTTTTKDNLEPIPLLVFNLGFDDTDLSQYWVRHQEAQDLFDYYRDAKSPIPAEIQASAVHICALFEQSSATTTTTTLWDKYRIFSQVMQFVTRAAAICPRTPKDKEAVARFLQQDPKSSSRPLIYTNPQSFLCCNISAKMQSFMSTVRMLQQLGAAEFVRSDLSAQKKLVHELLRAPLHVTIEWDDVNAKDQIFVAPQRTQHRYIHLESPLPQLSPAEQSRPLTIALAVNCLLPHALFCINPHATLLISLIHKAFPYARIVLLFEKNFYAWLAMFSANDLLLEADAASLMDVKEFRLQPNGHGAQSQAYIELAPEFTDEINMNVEKQHIAQRWIYQDSLSASVSAFPLSAQEEKAKAKSLLYALGLKKASAAHEEQRLSEGKPLKDYIAHSVSHLKTDAGDLPERSAGGFTRDAPRIATCYVVRDYADLPRQIDLLFSDSESLLIAAADRGINCVRLDMQGYGESQQAVSVDYFTAFQGVSVGEFFPMMKAHFTDMYSALAKMKSPVLRANVFAEAEDSNFGTKQQSSGFFAQVSVTDIVERMSLLGALSTVGESWTTSNIRNHLAAILDYNYAFRAILEQVHEEHQKQARQCKLAATPRAKQASATINSAAQSQSQLSRLSMPTQPSNFTFTQRYDLHWGFLRFFEALSTFAIDPKSDISLECLIADQIMNLCSSILGYYSLAERLAASGKFHCETEQTKSMLSFGCARGDELFELSHYFPSFVGVGVDINPHAIERAKQYYKKALDIELSWEKNTPMSYSEPLFFTTLQDMPDVLESNWLDPKFKIVTAMTVLCRHPETVIVERLHDIYPFGAFQAQLQELCSYVDLNGFLCLHNANYRLEDTEQISSFRPLFPFPNHLRLCALPPKEELVREKMGSGQVIELHQQMRAYDYWVYFRDKVAEAYQKQDETYKTKMAPGVMRLKPKNLYLPELLLRLYNNSSQDAKFGYTNCFNKQEQQMPRYGASIFWRMRKD